MSDTVCIMKDGKELIQGTPGSLRSYIRQNLLRIGFSGTGEAQTQRDALVHTGIVNFASVRDHSVFAGVDNSRTAFTIVNKWLLEHQADFNAIEIVEPSLEDVFLALTQ